MDATIEVTSPTDGSRLGSVSALPREAIADALSRAAATTPRLRRAPFAERAACLLRARTILLDRAMDVAKAIAREQGKPVTEALLAEVMPGLSTLAWLAREGAALLAPRPVAHTLPFLADKQARYIVEPRGLTTILSAWNYPFGIPFCQVATCVAAGNAVVFRPSSTTPLVGRMVAEIFHQAGVSPDSLQVVTCRSDVADELVVNPAVRTVIFTGSTEIGRQVMRQAAHGPCKVILELGGKDPFIVFEDANLARAARAASWSAFMNCGQTCSSTERVYVQASVVEPFTRLVAERARALVLGDPLDPDTDVGPMTTGEGLEKVAAQVRDALDRGARVVTGGQGRQGRFFEPTVLVDVTPEMRVMREETFGPLLPIASFKDEDEAVRLANDCEYGLTASVWTRDRERARRLVERLEAGTVTVNDANFTFAESAAPWGGVKATGLGRTHGPQGLLELTEVKFVSEDWSEREKQLWWHPYDEASLRFFQASLPALFAPGLMARAVGLLRLVPSFPRLAREASLPAILGRVPRLLMEP